MKNNKESNNNIFVFLAVILVFVLIIMILFYCLNYRSGAANNDFSKTTTTTTAHNNNINPIEYCENNIDTIYNKITNALKTSFTGKYYPEKLVIISKDKIDCNLSKVIDSNKLVLREKNNGNMIFVYGLSDNMVTCYYSELEYTNMDDYTAPSRYKREAYYAAREIVRSDFDSYSREQSDLKLGLLSDKRYTSGDKYTLSVCETDNNNKCLTHYFDYEINFKKKSFKRLENKIESNDEEESFNVSFDSNGGSEVASLTVKKGTKAIMPDNPSKDGYVFKSWMLNGKEYDFNLPIESNITLIAAYGIYGDVNGDEKINIVDANMIRRHAKGKMHLSDGQKRMADVNIDGDITEEDADIVKAYSANLINSLPYKVVTYRIVYELNGGYLEVENPSVYNILSNENELVVKNPKKTGHVFIGWTGTNVVNPETVLKINISSDMDLKYDANYLLYGDVNFDGKVNVIDANMIRRYANRLIELTDDQKKVADVNLDNKVTERDADIIKDYASNIITVLPQTN